MEQPNSPDAISGMNAAYEAARGRVAGGEGGSRGGHSMQPSEIATLISGFRKAGVAEAEIKAAIEGDGYTWPGDELKEQPKQPTEAQEFDTSSLAPNADPASYNINWFANKPTITM